tara:strand:+ start:80692 stop:80958 length:267 start_codon:yes stop_codon:yes gene_type:complete
MSLVIKYWCCASRAEGEWVISLFEGLAFPQEIINYFETKDYEFLSEFSVMNVLPKEIEEVFRLFGYTAIREFYNVNNKSFLKDFIFDE